MNVIWKFLALVGVSAVMVHLLLVLLVSHYAQTPIWDGVQAQVDERQLFVFEHDGSTRNILGSSDPSMIYAICWFDLTDGVSIQLNAPNIAAHFWTISVYDKQLRNLFSITRSASSDGVLDLTISGQDKTARLEDSNDLASTPIPQKRPENSSIVENTNENALSVRLDLQQGFALLKVFAPDTAHRLALSQFLKSATCS